MKPKIAAARSYMDKANREYSSLMTLVPQHLWPQSEQLVQGVWRSRNFLAQLVLERTTAARRLSVNRTMMDRTGGWEQNISWDDLQRVKSECGLGHLVAVEIYPVDGAVINVANIRHLWLMPPEFNLGWNPQMQLPHVTS